MRLKELSYHSFHRQRKGGAIAAEEIFKVESVKQAIENATPDNPVVLGVISQDATSASVVDVQLASDES